MKAAIQLFAILLLSLSIGSGIVSGQGAENESRKPAPKLVCKEIEDGSKIQIFREGVEKPILSQSAQSGHRPYIHPIVAPDGKGVLTENQPGHHKHQTGLYWGFTRLNGRDYFHNPGDKYWRRVSSAILKREANDSRDYVQWQTVYDLLDKNGKAVLRETQVWSLHDFGSHYQLDLNWSGEAKADVVIGKYDYGGLFLRMPWKKGIEGRVVNSARQVNERGNGKRAVWLDVGMKVEGRKDQAHIAIFDHPDNPGFPQPWRVDGQMGVGPVRAKLGDWKIAKDKTAKVRHRLIVQCDPWSDVDLTKEWSRFTGHSMPHVQWGLANREGRNAKFLTPSEAVKAMTIKEGFQVNVFASEPMMTQPMAFCWDDRGRLWIAENRDYETRGRGFANSGDSRILILEDTNRDGVADKRTVFAEGIPFPAGMAVGFDGLWLGAPPNLLFVPDKNRDDRADMKDIEVRLTGWGIRDRHETLNSFHWGPDGWLYGCQGFATPSNVGKPKGKGKQFKHKDPFPRSFEFDGKPTPINGGVWRYHPLKDRFEVVAHGFSNPWGIDYDAKGNLFITACVIPHLWHVIPGGVYHRQGGTHFNPYVYRDIRTIADHRHRSAHGGSRIYLSDWFPEKYHGRIFMANIHEHALLTDILAPKGSGFVGHHGDEVFHANNAQWIGFSLEIGPDGAVYVLDWHDADICGNDVLNKDTGRVFRVTPSNKKMPEWDKRFVDISKLSNSELIKLQTSPSAWHARRARLTLQHRAHEFRIGRKKDFKLTDCVNELEKLLRENTNADHRLRALWALHLIEGLNRDRLESLLKDKDEHIRAWSIQFLCEDKTPSESSLREFKAMAAKDESPVVRLYLAAALQRMPIKDRLPIISELVQHASDANDHNLPKMIWYGLEPCVTKFPTESIRIGSLSRIDLLQRFIARRLTDGNRLDSLIAAMNQHSENETYQLQLLLGMRDGLEGRYNVRAPEAWTTLYDKLQKREGFTAQVAMQLSQQFGDKVATQTLLTTLRNRSAKTELRIQALKSLTGQKPPELAKLLLKLLDEKTIRREAIRASAAFDSAELGKKMLASYSSMTEQEKLEVVQTMASRSGYGRQLTDAIRDKKISRKEIPAYLPRVLLRVVGNGFLEVWGPVDSLPAETQKDFAKYRKLLNTKSLGGADLSLGRAIFKKTCAACHKLYGEGGSIGPDITGANRGNLDYLLGNVLTPSAEIQDDYKTLIVLTDEGRMYSGILAGENERQLRMWIANHENPVVIAKSKIDSREIASVSTMPDGLLKQLSDKEVLNLMGYLMSEKQVELPKKK